ncbi:hypothetical protein PBY51_016070 [Eleginops maclovinus]|uniref:Uncharacterized protein n=1 Tax=Eleginops maclovinus TaxID=56733 RepID=A0AAN8ARX3_ELEMC|nr:hypothetical protein PBY51_016070 [Eleginops maclovinus]
MRISDTKKKSAVLAPPDDSYGHWLCTELQKERGILRFLGFSQPSPRCRFHITVANRDDDDDMRRACYNPAATPNGLCCTKSTQPKTR